MIALSAGHVRLSDRRTSITWDVDVAEFEISAHPVTRAQYATVAGHQPGEHDEDRRPVDSVSWWDAVRYCNALSEKSGLTPCYRLDGDDAAWDTAADGFRLPTEAEWEFACRAGTAGPRYGVLDDIAWYRDNSDGRSHDVGLKVANAWGLYDTLGNVFEWCWDVYDAEVYGTYRVLRGGGWYDEHWSCRASVRRRSHPTYSIDDVGFRIARH